MIQIEHFQAVAEANEFLKSFTTSEVRDIKIFFSTQHDTPEIFVIYDDFAYKTRKPSKAEKPKQSQKEETPVLGGP